jgi:predicted SAM-dependent methyltransferase
VSKLAIGERGQGSDGWQTFDLMDADILGFMWNIVGFNSGVDEIRCIHALEHVEKKMVLPTLREWHRVLRPGGVLTVEVPDLDFVCRHWLTHTPGIEDAWALDIIFGRQVDEGEFHKTGFNERLLRAALVEVGFEEPKIEKIWSHGQQSLSARTVRG